MDFDKLNDLEVIGLAFITGIIAGNYKKEESRENGCGEKPKKHLKTGTIEVKEIEPKEMLDILDTLKNKIMKEEQ